MRTVRCSIPDAQSPGSLLGNVDARHVVLGENRVDIVLPPFDELLEPLMARGVAAARRHRNGKGLRQDAAVHLRLHGYDIERYGLALGEIARSEERRVGKEGRSRGAP